MTSPPSRSYTLRTSSARPTPCVLSTAIVRTLCVVMVIFLLRARDRFLISLSRRRRHSTLPHRLRLRAKNFLLSVILSLIPLSLSPFLPRILVSQHEISRPTPRRPVRLPTPRRIWCLLAGFSPPYSFPRRYASFGTTTVGTNGLLTCGFNWQCTADAIGYAVSWSQHAWTPYRLLISTVWVHPGKEAAGAGYGIISH